MMCVWMFWNQLLMLLLSFCLLNFGFGCVLLCECDEQYFWQDDLVKFIDWFVDGFVYVVDFVLVCCGVESGVVVLVNVLVCEEILDGVLIVVFVFGMVIIGLVFVVFDIVYEFKCNYFVDVVVFGVCVCVGGLYWDLVGVVVGFLDVGVDVDYWILGCFFGFEMFIGLLVLFWEVV